MYTVDINSEDGEINIIRRWELSSLQHVWFMKPDYWKYEPTDKFLYLNATTLKQAYGGILSQDTGSKVTELFAPVRKWHYKEELIWLLKEAKHSKLVEARKHLENNANFDPVDRCKAGVQFSSEENKMLQQLVENTPQINDVVVFNYKEHPNEWRISTVKNITNVTQAEAEAKARAEAAVKAQAEAAVKAQARAPELDGAEAQAPELGEAIQKYTDGIQECLQGNYMLACQQFLQDACKLFQMYSLGKEVSVDPAVELSQLKEKVTVKYKDHIYYTIQMNEFECTCAKRYTDFATLKNQVDQLDIRVDCGIPAQLTSRPEIGSPEGKARRKGLEKYLQTLVDMTINKTKYHEFSLALPDLAKVVIDFLGMSEKTRLEKEAIQLYIRGVIRMSLVADNKYWMACSYFKLACELLHKAQTYISVIVNPVVDESETSTVYYNITVSDSQGHQHTCRKQYDDFDNLSSVANTSITEKHMRIRTTFPPKHTFSPPKRGTDDFEQRREGLQKYLQELVDKTINTDQKAQNYKNSLLVGIVNDFLNITATYPEWCAQSPRFDSVPGPRVNPFPRRPTWANGVIE